MQPAAIAAAIEPVGIAAALEPATIAAATGSATTYVETLAGGWMYSMEVLCLLTNCHLLASSPQWDENVSCSLR